MALTLTDDKTSSPPISHLLQLDKLHFDIVDSVAFQISRPCDLLSFALTCKSICSVVIPLHLEYRQLHFWQSHSAVWDHLAQRPLLAGRIRDLTLCQSPLSIVEVYPRTLVEQPSEGNADLNENGKRQHGDGQVGSRKVQRTDRGEAGPWAVDSNASISSPATAHLLPFPVSKLEQLATLEKFDWTGRLDTLAQSKNLIKSLCGLSGLRSVRLADSHVRNVNGMPQSSEDKILSALQETIQPIWDLPALTRLELIGGFLWPKLLNAGRGIHFHNLKGLQELALTYSSASPPSFFNVHFPRLRVLTLDTTDNYLTVSAQNIVDFLVSHTTLEEVTWSPGRLASYRVPRGVTEENANFLPNLKRITGNFDFVSSIWFDVARGTEKIKQRRLEYISFTLPMWTTLGSVFWRDLLPIMKPLRTVKELRLDFDKRQMDEENNWKILSQLARVVPNLTDLTISGRQPWQKYAAGGKPPAEDAHLHALSQFPKLEYLSHLGLCIAIPSPPKSRQPKPPAGIPASGSRVLRSSTVAQRTGGPSASIHPITGASASVRAPARKLDRQLQAKQLLLHFHTVCPSLQKLCFRTGYLSHMACYVEVDLPLGEGAIKLRKPRNIMGSSRIMDPRTVLCSVAVIG